MKSVTEDQFHRMFNINVLGLLLTTKAALKHIGEGGSIINIGSVVSRVTPPASSVYTGTKGAVDAITGVLARELGPKKIRVNTINPGMVETEGSAQLRDSSALTSRKLWWLKPRLAVSGSPVISRRLRSFLLPTIRVGLRASRSSPAAGSANRSAPCSMCSRGACADETFCSSKESN